LKTSRRTDVAFFLPNMQGGGAERVMANLANSLSNREMTVDFVLGKAEGPNLKKLTKNVNVVDLGSKNVFGWLKPIMQYLKTTKPRIVFSGLHHANLIALWAKMLTGVPCKVIVSVHGQMSQDIGNSKKKLAKVIPFLTKIFYPRADKVVCVSYGVAEELVNKYGLPTKNIKVIYNPVITNDIFERAEESVDHPWFQPGQPPVILGIGRLHPQKDFPTLIKAFALVRKKIEARLMILGEGSERAKLERNKVTNVIPLQLAVSETEGEMQVSSAAGSSVITQAGTGLSVKVTTIDKFVEANKLPRVDFIKMDVEGHELKVLEGADETIKTFKPSLALSAYHRGDDLIELPQLLLKFYPHYEFYLKHCNPSWPETLLYARKV